MDNQEYEFTEFLEKFDVAKLHQYIKRQQFLTDCKLISKSSSSCTEDKYLSLVDCEDKISELTAKYFLANNPLTRPVPYQFWLPIQQFVLSSYLKHSK